MLISLHAQGMGRVSFPVLRLWTALLYLAFYTGTGDLNSGPHACVATAVSTGPSPQPSTRTLKKCFDLCFMGICVCHLCVCTHANVLALYTIKYFAHLTAGSRKALSHFRKLKNLPKNCLQYIVCLLCSETSFLFPPCLWAGHLIRL